MKQGNGCLSRIALSLAFLAVGIMVLTLPIALAGRDLAQIIFQPDALTQVLKNQVLDSGLIGDRLRETFVSDQWMDALGAEGSELRPVFKHLSPSEREEILALALPEGWLQAQVERMIRGFYAWVDSDQTLPRVGLDMTPVKAHLLRGGIDAMVEILMDSWPSCTDEQAAQLGQEILRAGTLPESFCEPSEPLRSQLALVAASSLKEQVDQIPNFAPFLESTNTSEAVQMKEQLRFLRAIMLWGWFLPLSLLGFVMALAIRSREDLQRWWSLPLLLSGAATFIWALIGSASRLRVARNISQGVAGEGALLQSAVQAGFDGILKEALGSLYVQSFVLIAAGAAIWFGLRLLRSKTTPASSAAATAELSTPLAAEPPPVRPIHEDAAEQDEPADPPSGIFG